MILQLLFLLPALAPSLAPSQKSRDLRKNAPENCPWCKGDPELMRPAGVVSHGGFEFAATDTPRVDKLLGSKDIYWIETAHFELGLILGPQRVGTEESKKLRAELTELAVGLPEVDPKTRTLDPWLRAHLYGQRAEKVWKRVLELLQAKESDFPDGKSVWMLGTPYMGEGPYLGQKGKYELVIVPTSADQVVLLREHFGLSIELTQRWNVVERDTLIVVTNLEENDLSSDERIHGHVVFNLTANLLDGFKHYSYDTPRWIQEGLAHFVEREVNPRFNSFDISEGADIVKVNKEDWDAEARKLALGGEAPRVAELTALRTFAEFKLAHHYACWSMTKFMVETNPKGYACLNDELHGIKNDEGMPDNSNLPDRQRAAFQECLGLSYVEFDAAWQAWCLSK